MDKRMAGDYEIIQSFHIGDQEVVLGENVNAPPEERYMCAYCQQNEIVALYNDVLVSDDFCEIAKLYGERLTQQAEKTRVAMFKPKFQGIDTTPLTKADCTPLSHEDDLNGKVVVIKPEVLRREYQMATNQIKLCTGGFGASPHSRGSACFCVDLYSGKEARFERQDILGILDNHSFPNGRRWGLTNTAMSTGRNPIKTERNADGTENKCRLCHYGLRPYRRYRICDWTERKRPCTICHMGLR